MRSWISIVLVSTMLVCAMVFPASAAEQNTYKDTEIIHTEYGNIEVDTTLVIYDSLFRSNTKSADKIHTFKYGGTQIAEVTLSATFGYDGKTAWVVSTDSSYTTSNGWSYRNEEISTSGNTATLTASLYKLLDGTIPVNISISCTPTGQMS